MGLLPALPALPALAAAVVACFITALPLSYAARNFDEVSQLLLQLRSLTLVSLNSSGSSSST